MRVKEILLDHTDLSWVRAVLFDLDGVVFVGSTRLPGAQEVFDWLDEHGYPYCLVTNNSTQTPLQYQQKLAGMGIRVPLKAIYTSALATAQYLKKEYPAGAPAFWIGEDGVTEALTEQGFWLDEEHPKLVCVGWDRQLTYAKLRLACLMIRGGARFVGTNPDKTLPTEDGLVPGNGAALAALQTATDVTPTIIGKPAPAMIDLAIERIGATKESTLIIGDRLDTDVGAGAAAGIATALVLTGVHTVADIPDFPVEPVYIVDDLIQFQEALAGQSAARRYRSPVVGKE